MCSIGYNLKKLQSFRSEDKKTLSLPVSDFEEKNYQPTGQKELSWKNGLVSGEKVAEGERESKKKGERGEGARSQEGNGDC